MNTVSAMANQLDKIFRVIRILLNIALVACLVSIGLITAGLILKWDPEKMGTGFEVIDMESLQLTVAPPYIPDKRLILAQTLAELCYTLLCLIVGRKALTCVQNMLVPMTQGQPFHETVCRNLQKLSGYCYSLFFAVFFLDNVAKISLVKAYDLELLMLSERISQVKLEPVFDFSFLLFGAFLSLLTYIFRYGQQLQTLSDETL